VYTIDLILGGYPTFDAGVVADLINGLGASQVPFHCWVALSSDRGSLAKLHGDPDVNWRGITNILASPPFQFTGDSFWRVSNVTDFGGAVVKSIVEQAGNDNARLLQCTYQLMEGQHYRVHLESNTPEGVLTTGRILVVTGGGDRMAFSSVNSTRLSLRRYAKFSVEMRANRFDEIDPRFDGMQLSTEAATTQAPAAPAAKSAVTGGQFPVGPSLTLHFSVAKSTKRLLGGIGAVLAGDILAVLGKPALDSGLIGSVGLILLIFALGAIGTTLLWGKPKFFR
jgi:hypothetical protein